MVEPTIVPRAAHTISRRDIDPDCSQGPLQAPRAQLRRLPRRRQRARSAARAPAQGLRHRDLGASASGQEALSQLLDHRPAVPARPREVRDQDHRGRDVPPSGRRASSRPKSRRPPSPTDGGRHRSRAKPRRTTTSAPRRGAVGPLAADSPRQHLRHARRGRVPPRLHRQRALLRHRDVLDHRLRRRPARISMRA